MQQNENPQANWLSLASVWLGGMVSIPSLLIGSTLISGLSFYASLFAGLVGIGFVTAFMCLESVAAAREKLNTVQLTRHAFGYQGGAILSLTKSFQKEAAKKFNWMGFTAWGVGVAMMILMVDPIKNLLAIFVSGLVFWVLTKLVD